MLDGASMVIRVPGNDAVAERNWISAMIAREVCASDNPNAIH
jgi:hypothetical protein